MNGNPRPQAFIDFSWEKKHEDSDNASNATIDKSIQVSEFNSTACMQSDNYASWLDTCGTHLQFAFLWLLHSVL